MEQFKSCQLCPRLCGVDRVNRKKGVCKVSSQLKVARAALHFWEEPCISGTNGSGTVFFSGCSLHCVFCQNEKIAQGIAGKEIEKERLADIFLELQEKRANNINLVTPSHYVPYIVWAVEHARNQGLTIPIVYNTSSYEQVDTIKQLEGIVDVYLPDFKYWNPEIAKKYSNAYDYPDVAKRVIAEMVRQRPNVTFAYEKNAVSSNMLVLNHKDTKNTENKNAFDTKEMVDGQTQQILQDNNIEESEVPLIMQKGVIVRQLLLPNLLEDAKQIIKYLYKTYGDTIYLSLMSQFTPLPHLKNYPELNRKVTEEEYEAYIDYAIDLGVENGFIQEGNVAEESFIPEFNGEGV